MRGASTPRLFMIQHNMPPAVANDPRTLTLLGLCQKLAGKTNEARAYFRARGRGHETNARRRLSRSMRDSCRAISPGRMPALAKKTRRWSRRDRPLLITTTML